MLYSTVAAMARAADATIGLHAVGAAAPGAREAAAVDGQRGVAVLNAEPMHVMPLLRFCRRLWHLPWRQLWFSLWCLPWRQLWFSLWCLP